MEQAPGTAQHQYGVRRYAWVTAHAIHRAARYVSSAWLLIGFESWRLQPWQDQAGSTYQLEADRPDSAQ